MTNETDKTEYTKGEIEYASLRYRMSKEDLNRYGKNLDDFHSRMDGHDPFKVTADDVIFTCKKSGLAKVISEGLLKAAESKKVRAQLKIAVGLFGSVVLQNYDMDSTLKGIGYFALGCEVLTGLLNYRSAEWGERLVKENFRED